jgi:hypothetical protein
MTMRALAVATLSAGLVVLAISQLFLAMHMRSVQPLNGAYGNEAMLAFELARTPDELATVIGRDPPTEEAIAVRRIFDKANRLDFAYMAFYAVFIALSCLCAARARGRKWLLVGVVLGPLAALFDVGENLVLLQLTQPGADVSALLPSLELRTMLKWELLAVTSALFAAAFVGAGRAWVSLLAGVIALVCLASGVLTLLDPAAYSVVLLYAIAAVWIWQIGYAAMLSLRKA